MTKTAHDRKLIELRKLRDEYELSSGHQGFMHVTVPVTTEYYVFGDGTRIAGIDEAIRYQTELLEPVRLCEHSRVARSTHSGSYCKACGANV